MITAKTLSAFLSTTGMSLSTSEVREATWMSKLFSLDCFSSTIILLAAIFWLSCKSICLSIAYLPYFSRTFISRGIVFPLKSLDTINWYTTDLDAPPLKLLKLLWVPASSITITPFGAEKSTVTSSALPCCTFCKSNCISKGTFFFNVSPLADVMA